jgi:sugar phosphate isomerase/epimerase
MQLGVSSYSFARSLIAGRKTLLDVVDWTADSDADHLEIATGGQLVDLRDEPDLVADLRGRADDRGVELANYVVGADFRSDDVEAEIAGVKAHLEVAHRLGITRLRHDVTAWVWQASTQEEIESTLERVIPICQDLADHAATLGITTMVENHGFFINFSERLRRLVHAVDRPNFRLLLDVGNFLCIDEDPLVAVPLSLPLAEVVHLKDFRVLDTAPPGDDWLETLAGRGILGTVVGYGDLQIERVVAQIKHAGYRGPLSIEFEGLEDEEFALATGIANARRIWEAAA